MNGTRSCQATTLCERIASMRKTAIVPAPEGHPTGSAKTLRSTSWKGDKQVRATQVSTRSMMRRVTCNLKQAVARSCTARRRGPCSLISGEQSCSTSVLLITYARLAGNAVEKGYRASAKYDTAEQNGDALRVEQRCNNEAEWPVDGPRSRNTSASSR